MNPRNKSKYWVTGAWARNRFRRTRAKAVFYLWLFFLTWLLPHTFPQPLRAAIAFDAASSGNFQNVTVQTLSHTCTGSDLGLYVFASLRGPSSGFSVTGVEYASVAMTLEVTHDNTIISPGQYLCTEWSLENPATGTNDIEVTYSAEVDNATIAGISLTGVDQTDSTEATASDEGEDPTQPTIDITTITDNAMVVDSLGDFGNSATYTAGPGQTKRWELTGVGELGGGAGSTEPKVTAGSVTMSWSDVEDNVWTMIALAIKPAAAATERYQTRVLRQAGGYF